MVYSSWYRSFFVLSLVAAVSFSAVPEEARAQRWLQTATVQTPVDEGTAAKAVLDTLQGMSRAPDSDEQMTIPELSDELLNSGFAFRSVSHLYIDYRFVIGNQGFQQKITGLEFISRPPGGGEDVPILYLNARKDWVKKFLQSKGTPLESNLATLIPFSDQLAFARLARRGDDTVVTQKGGEIIRGDDQALAAKKDLLNQVIRLTYSQ
jgi:hypothetical protein